MLSTADLRIVVPLIGAFTGFILFWFSFESAMLKRRFHQRFGQFWGTVNAVIYTKYLGAISMGVLPALFYLAVFPSVTLKEIGFGLQRENLLTIILWIVGLWAVVIPVLIFVGKKPNNLAKHPEIRVNEWDLRLILKFLAAWALYLLGYELMFRGVLLFPLVDAIGLWPAIAINAILYAGSHIPKGLDETIGAIPLSVILCLLCIHTGSIWIAYFVHLSMAFTVTLTGIRHNPEMNLVKRIST